MNVGNSFVKCLSRHRNILRNYIADELVKVGKELAKSDIQRDIEILIA